MLSACFNRCIELLIRQKKKKKKNPEKILKIKPFIDQQIWKEISFPSNQKDWKRS